MNTQFEKGHITWNKGKKLSYPVWNKGTKGIMKPNETSFKKGHIKSQRWYDAMKKMRGNTFGFKKGQTAWNKGKPAPWAEGNKHSAGRVPWNKGLKGFMAGPKNSNWRGGVTSLHEKIRKSDEYQQWRGAVLKRDGWKCVRCGVVQSRKARVVVDHIKPFTLFPALRFVVENGRTFCKSCDDKYGFKWNRHLSWDENFQRYQSINV